MQTLAVQEYLRAGKDPAELGIKVTKHPMLPLLILNYSQFDSPKTNPIVMQSRGLVLEQKTFDVVGRAFNRFFNLGEVDVPFDWGCFSCEEKIDGSLIIVYNYRDNWMVNTRGSFGDATTECGKTFRSLFNEVAPANLFDRLNSCFSYAFELVGPYNKVVREYKTAKLFLLNVYDKIVGFNTDHDIDMDKPELFSLSSLDEVRAFLSLKEKEDPTFEGVVLTDRLNQRIKVKSRTYLELHHLKSNGAIASKRSFVHFYINNEQDEILSRFPEYADIFKRFTDILDLAITEASFVYEQHCHLESQKDFALAVKNCAGAAWIFNARKQRISVKEAALRDERGLERVLKERELFDEKEKRLG